MEFGLCKTIVIDHTTQLICANMMVEYFSKWIELVPLFDKYSEGITYAFLDQLLNQFEAQIEVFIDQGKEFLERFQMLCEQPLIDHHTTSCD
jgi:hypothetical protein